MIETPSVRSRPAELDQSAPRNLDVCHGYRTAFDVELKCELGERRMSHRRQPNSRRISVPLSPCQVQLQSAPHGERAGVRGRSVFGVRWFPVRGCRGLARAGQVETNVAGIPIVVALDTTAESVTVIDRRTGERIPFVNLYP
jgi:hypothetical protein